MGKLQRKKHGKSIKNYLVLSSLVNDQGVGCIGEIFGMVGSCFGELLGLCCDMFK